MSTSPEQDRPSAVVVGAGIGGSALTLLLAEAGFAVTLLEKNRYLGGSCAGYEKHGFQIDFGTHMFTRGPRGPLGEVLRRTGNEGAIEFRRTRDIAEMRHPSRDGSGGVDRIPVPAAPHRMPVLAARMVRSMGLSPQECVQAARLVTSMMTAGEREIDAWMHRTVDEYVAQFTQNPRLHAVLCFLMGLYFVIPPWDTSAGEAIYCFQRMARDNWLSYPVGGAKAIPETYCALAEKAGAQIRTSAGVSQVLVEEGRAVGVRLEDGSEVRADLVVSTSSLRTTALRLCPPGSLPEDYLDRARANQQSVIAIQAKFALDRKLVDAGCLIGGFGGGLDLLSVEAGTLQQMFATCLHGQVPAMIPFYCPVPTNFDPSLAPEGGQLLTVCALAPTTDVELKDPPAEWEAALHRTMRAVVPGLDEATLFVDRTTTSWMEHWLGKEHGPAISTAQTPEQVGDKRPSVVTPLPGLYLAGDGAGGRGVGTELAADSAMECAETIVAALGRPLPARWDTDRHAQAGVVRMTRDLIASPLASYA